jgi:hypothetical protein
MANKIVLKKSSVVGKVPTTSDLDYGEVALNYADGRLYFKTSTNEIDYFNTGIGDVVQIANGGTGATTRADAINNLLPVQTTASGQFLTTDGTNVSWASPAPSSSSISLRDFKKYIYSISSNVSTVSGVDINGFTLEYTLGKVDVYQNGIRLVEGLDYTATDQVSILFTVNLTTNDTVEVLSYASAYFLESPLLGDYEQLTTTEADQTIDTYDKTIYRTAKYLIQAIAGADVHATEVLITHNDTDVFITEYATIYSSATPLISVTGIIDANNVIVKVTPLNDGTTIDFVRTSLAARTILSIEGDLMSQTGTEDLMTGSGDIDLMD